MKKAIIGDYGYDAPYALVMFACAGIGTALAALYQSGNARDVTLRNAAIESAADRVSVETGDMRALPFVDASIDLVVSSLAIHNISGNADHRKRDAEATNLRGAWFSIVFGDAGHIGNQLCFRIITRP